MNKATLKDAYKLLHNGVLALADCEHEGIRIDTEYLDRTLEETREKLKELDRGLRDSREWSLWRKRFKNPNLDSHDQLAVVLFEVMGLPNSGKTESGKWSSDEAALSKVGTPFTKAYLERMKVAKVYGTYLKGIRREVDENGFIHPVFNLHTTVTYRSSSDTPNFQNMPIRNPVMGKIIRRCFIPRPGHVLVECDYSGVEVRVAACYHKDKNMLSYINDTSRDMHRDMGAQIYKLDADWMKANGKNIRAVAKNKFVFPQFYGSWYVSCARDMWEEIYTRKLTGPDGDSLYEHLKKNGIRELGACDPKQKPKKGTFEEHMKNVEDDFWNNRFKAYGKWKKSWYAQYQEEGGFDTLTGFRIDGAMGKNDVINYPVQGAAFHCLLWSVTRINSILRKRKMASRIVGQIHDSCIGDVKIEELTEYMEIVKRVMTVEIEKKFPWLIVPLAIEADITPPNGSWNDKTETKYDAGKYTVEMKEKDASGEEVKKSYTFNDPIKFCAFLAQRNTNGRKAA